MKKTVEVYKVFVGTHDTYEKEEYQFIGNYDECVDYVNTYGYQTCSYIEPIGIQERSFMSDYAKEDTTFLKSETIMSSTK